MSDPKPRVFSELSGVTSILGSRSKADITNFAIRLMTCEDHRGVHHFAVIREGTAIAVSTVGLECLQMYQAEAADRKKKGRRA